MASKQELINDQRFSRVTKDPRFWEMPEKDCKIKIDKRFRSMFHDERFKLKYTVDKRVRPINRSSTEDLKRFYDLSDSDTDVSATDNQVSSGKKTKGKKAKSKKGLESRQSLLGCQSQEGSKINKQKTDHPSESKPDGDKNEGQKHVTEIGASSKSKFEKTSMETKAANESVQDKWEDPPAVNSENEDDTHEYSHFSRSWLDDETSKNKASSELEGSEDDREMETDLEDSGEMGEEEDADESDSGPDLARGKGNVETSSEDEEEEDLTEIFPKEPEIEHSWREMDKDAPRTDEVTSRLVVCNMDWDRLKAKDLLALFNSFTPEGGVILSVKVYPSEYGKERLKEEETQGPVELLSLPEDTTEKDWIYKEKLREYQFKRLKYFYAVVQCDSPETANKIYEECDGLEFESSCSFVDLRFIPDDVTFDDEPKDIVSEVDGAAYKPKYFTSAAMGTSKVDLTWDETDHERITSLSRNFKKDELLDMDFQAYLASSSEEEEEEQQGGDVAYERKDDGPKKSQKEDDEQIAKYRELLQSIQEKEKKLEENDIEMEIKWVPGLKETAEEMVRNKLEGKDKLTTWEQFLEKKKEKRKLKKKRKVPAEEELSEDEFPADVDINDPYFAEELGKTDLKKKTKKYKTKADAPENEDELERQKAEMALLMMDEEEETKKHFNYEKIVEQQNLSKKKKKQLMKKKELVDDEFQVNVADPRFQAMYSSHLFNLDPSDPNFKKTKAVEKILEEKARRREQNEQELSEAVQGQESKMRKKGIVNAKSIDPALSMLIKSVKNKTQQFQARKKHKVK
uniref:ESF1 nucleolar pre-rRNA processing protein homolog n=1 Tax=Sphenodon punctatus TaxID=8508 RepID=A0A8D0H9W0_SPHPU